MAKRGLDLSIYNDERLTFNTYKLRAWHAANDLRLAARGPE